MNFADREVGEFDATAEYEEFGNCLALSPDIYGKEGRYYQSDVQFAQQVVELARKYDAENIDEEDG